MAPRGYLVCLALLAVQCIGQSITATSRTENDTETMDIFLYSPGGGGDLDKRAPVLPLTEDIRDMESIDLTGSVFRTDTGNQVDLMPFDIAIISCDASDYPGNLNVNSVFDLAVGRNVSAILFYTTVSDYCAFNVSGSSDYSRVFSLQSASDAEDVLSDIPRGSGDITAPRWTIGDADLGDDDDSGRPNYSTGIQGTGQSQRQGGDDDDDDDNGGALGPRPSTAVAMIILYSITGIITALFLTIIVTGAVRAHRHPERYGPRRMLGMPRQSRAKGLGRAILDTIPIVKVGQRGQHDKPAEDVELGERNAENDNAPNSNATPSAPGDSDETTSAAAAGTTTSNDHDHDNEHNHDHVTAPPTKADPDRHQGCSICTEDFVEGQDQRVLPCDHRYHPDCIDPWLLNVSSTCPLCRIDLRPKNVDADGNPIEGDAEGSGEGQGEGLAPPVGQVGEEGRRSVRRSLVAGVLGIGGGGRMERMSGEERLAVLRRYRAQQAARRSRESGTGDGEASGAPADAEGDGGEGARVRLRNLFSRRGIRTRRSGQREGEERNVEASDAVGGGAPADSSHADDRNGS